MSPSFSVDWFSRNIPSFQRHLALYAGKSSLRFLEIGSFEGRSTCWLLDHILTGPESTVTCVDTWEGSMEHQPGQKASIWETFSRNLSTYPPERVQVRRGRSSERLRELPFGSMDFVYVDGSHTSRDVLSDAVLSFDLLKVGGVMAFDDYLWQGYPNQPLLNPKTGIDAFLVCYQGRYELLERDYIVFIRKTRD